MNETKIRILGTVAPYPKNNMNCPGYLIKDDKYNILLDCGNGSSRLLNMKEDLNNLKIFISHLHPDHIGDLASLLQTINVYKKYGYVDGNIDLFIPESFETRKISYIDNDGWGASKSEKLHMHDYDYIEKYANLAGVNIYKISKDLTFDNIYIESISVPHPIESYAFKVKTNSGTIVYSGDTGTKNNLNKFAKECDLFICESTFLRGQYRAEDYHLYAHEAAKIATEANVEKLILTHFWPEIDKSEYVNEAKEIFENVEEAIEGKEYVLKKKIKKTSN